MSTSSKENAFTYKSTNLQAIHQCQGLVQDPDLIQEALEIEKLSRDHLVEISVLFVENMDIGQVIVQKVMVWE